MCKKFFVSAVMALLIVVPSHAATTADILNSMTGKEVGAYMGASVEMMAFMAYINGNKSAYECILNWQYGQDNGAAQYLQAMRSFPDKTPQSVLFSLVKRQCGDPRSISQ